MLANVDPALAQEPTAVAAPPWLARARVAGFEVHAEMSDSEIMQNLSIFADQNVSVIEADSDLSRLLTDKQFEAEIALMRRYWPPMQITRPAALLGGLRQGSYDKVVAGGEQTLNLATETLRDGSGSALLGTLALAVAVGLLVGRRLTDHRALRRTL